MTLDALETTAEKVLVTVAPPTPNGDLHLGHLSGPYIASDVYARFARGKGLRTHFVSGSDDNQSYVPLKGEKTGKTAQEVVDHYTRTIPATLSRANVALDYFLRPTKTPEYVAFVQAFFNRLVIDNKIERRQTPSLYCGKCELYLYEAHVRGGCPRCDEATNGNGCEKCGYVNDCTDLEEPRCNHCNEAPSFRIFERFYFPLSEYRTLLAEYLPTVTMNSHLRSLTADFVKDGYPDISASHVASWGIPVNLPGFEGQVIYEWLEMAAGYLFIAQALDSERGWESLWKDPNAAVVQCFGFDNAFFYTSFIPAVLKAYDPEIRLPKVFLSNEFYQLDGLKFSTSRNHAVWGDQVLETVPADVLRFHLAYTRPENEQTNFTLDEFRRTAYRLADEWEPWFRDVRARGENLEAPPLTAEERQMLSRVPAWKAEAEIHYAAKTFSLLSASRLLERIVFEARQFSKRQAFQPTPGTYYVEAELLKAFVAIAEPLMPDLAKWTPGYFTKAAQAVDEIR